MRKKVACSPLAPGRPAVPASSSDSARRRRSVHRGRGASRHMPHGAIAGHRIEDEWCGCRVCQRHDTNTNDHEVSTSLHRFMPPVARSRRTTWQRRPLVIGTEAEHDVGHRAMGSIALPEARHRSSKPGRNARRAPFQPDSALAKTLLAPKARHQEGTRRSGLT